MRRLGTVPRKPLCLHVLLCALVSTVAATQVACGGSDGGSGGGGSDAGSADGGGGGGPDACTGDSCTASPAVVFLFDQEDRKILRLEDRNLDGDALDPGEVKLFFDNSGPEGLFNSQGMLALGPGELLATDNITQVNTDSDVVHLIDQNGDGDALDDGEAAMYWTGALPGGGSLTNPVALTRDPGGSLYLTQNDFSDDQPDAIYRLSDDNGNGSVDDDGEVTIDFDLASVTPTPQILDLTFDAAGRAYGVDIRTPQDDPNNASVNMLSADGNSWTEILDSGQLYTMTEGTDYLIIPPTTTEVGYFPGTDEVVMATIDVMGDYDDHLVAMHDTDGNGAIGPGEFRVAWSSDVAVKKGDFAGLRDFTVLPDDSAFVTDGGKNRVWRLRDLDGDGRLDGPGETTLFYDSDAALAAGLPGVENAFTTAVWTPAPASVTK